MKRKLVVTNNEMNLEIELKKLGYIRWDHQVKPQVNQEYIHRWYKEKGKWVMEYYIKNEKISFNLRVTDKIPRHN